jgi:hypothetical protein
MRIISVARVGGPRITDRECGEGLGDASVDSRWTPTRRLRMEAGYYSIIDQCLRNCLHATTTASGFDSNAMPPDYRTQAPTSLVLIDLECNEISQMQIIRYS